ncbi:flavodoxin [Vibrio sp. CK2-1]|uniref:flavodoxin n=1 Tax=Vibrio sp. CK2-1 TaxID=2912249 RepID=UPI001F3B7B9B|nr:flavodoxin [Vibrio sp. CK2-1]MCF7354993.1 flavodoxin [Vibrio sp. CK2-1]
MQSQIDSYISAKNHWLSQQVDVEHPTPESLMGRKLYLEAQQNVKYSVSEIESLLSNKAELSNKAGLDVIEVDFHRLTILFSVLQASQLSDIPENQSLIIEFLTQIILDDEYQLFLGFDDGEAVSALICKIDQDDQVAVLTDIVISENAQDSFKTQDFSSDVLQYLISKSLIIHKVIHPDWV